MSKLPGVGTTIFSVMSKMAADHQAINLAQGFPDFELDPQLKNIIKEDFPSSIHQYAPMAGRPELLMEISKNNLATYGANFSPQEEILVTAGATQAIYSTLQALVYDGDEVLVLDPSYDCYVPAIQLAGGLPVRVNLNDDFQPDWQEINKRVSTKTKMLILNNPHNPSGAMWKDEDFRELEKLAQKYPHLLFLSDEVYEYIYFEKNFISMRNNNLLKNRTVIVASFGKTFHVTGWKLGYALAPKHLMDEIKKVHQFQVFSVNSLSQEIISRYARIADYDEIRQMYKRKRDLFKNLMEASRFDLLPCHGTYFQLASYKKISDEKDTDFCKRMVEEAGVAAIPISVFYADGRDEQVVRFCFAKKDETLIESAKRLCRL